MLARVHRLFDTDRDGALSDSELNALQLHCFKSTLQVGGLWREEGGGWGGVGRERWCGEWDRVLYVHPSDCMRMPTATALPAASLPNCLPACLTD